MQALTARRAWVVYLVAAGLVASPYWSVSPIPAAVLWGVVGWSSVAAVVIGVRMHKPAVRAPWYLLAGSLALFSLGDNIYSFQVEVLHSDAFPSVADVFYLAMYPVGVIGLALLVRHRSRGHDRPSVIDAAIVTASLGVLAWVFLISPNVHGDAGMAARLVSAAYPVFDIALLAVSVRLAVGGGKKPVAFYFLVSAIVGMLVSDALYGFKVLEGTWQDQSMVDLGWLGLYLLWGAAALHPSMRQLTEDPSLAPSSSWRRVTAVGIAAIGPSLLQIVHPMRHDVAPVAFATIVMFVLVIARVSWLMREVAGNEIEARFREAALGEATEASRQKSLFLANMSHEIRTPLNGVVGMIELLRETKLDAEQRDYAATLADSAKYLSELVNDVLDFSRIEAGKLEVETEPFDLRATVDAALNVGVARAQEKGLELVAIVDRDVPNVVVGDHIRVRQVLGNLVANATKFTNVGHVLVHVRRDPDGAVVFAVDDTGIGLAPEGRDKLFEQFVQADDSTTRRFHGSGLGLAISKQLVTLMGGEIGVESDRGQGSTFWFRIPFVVPAKGDHPVRNPLVAGRRALVVTPHELTASALARMLEHWGMECTVITAARAIPRMTNPPDGQRFDVMIIDAMPEQIPLVRRVRSDPRLSATGVIALSPVRHASGEAGDPVDAWITKPVRSSNLLDCVESLLARPPVELHAEEPAEPTETPPTRRVLVVEDNMVNQKVATALLGQLGYDTTVASDGVEALQLLETDSFDAILMDCQMPRMDGYEATLEIRRRETGRRTPIIAMTASALYSDKEHCLSVGMDEYLTKPINRDTLAETLARFVAVPAA